MDATRRSAGFPPLRASRCALSLVVLLSALLFGRAMPTAQAAEVRTGYLPATSFAPIFIALEKGFYKEAGVEVTLQRFASGSKMIAPLSSGALDVAAGGWGAGLINAIAAGTDMRVVADKGQVRPGHGFVMFQVRKDLFDSGQVKGVKDLKGMKLATYGAGLAGQYFLAKLFEAGGAAYEDDRWVQLAPPQAFQALQNKAVAGSFAVEPWGTRATEAGLAVNLTRADQLPETKVFQIALIMYGGKFIRERHGDAKNTMKGYVKGIRFLNERGPANDEVVAILGKFTKVPADILKKSIPFYLANDGKPHLESMQALQEWLFKGQLITKMVPLSQLVDLQFLE